MIPAEIWTLVALHLKPRYLARLLAVSKPIHRAVDNETYWTRVASHLTWRTCPLMELRHDEDNILPPVDPELNLYDMMALDRGYYWSMQHFIERIDAVGDAYSKRLESGDPCWDGWKASSLKDKTVAFFVDSELLLLEGDAGVSIAVSMKKSGGETELTMKELARRIVMAEKTTRRCTTAKLVKFMWEIEEDAALAPPIKRNVIRKFRAMLYDLDSDSGYLLSMSSPTDIANFFRRF